MVHTLPALSREEEQLLLYNPKFEPFLLAQYRNWDLYLSQDQNCIGRAYVWHSSRHVDMHPLEDLSEDEIAVLMRVIRDYKRLIGDLFCPDMWNQAWLGNELHIHRGHGHLHLIPRYKNRREWNGISFLDHRWGKPQTSDFRRKLDEQVEHTLVTLIRDGLAIQSNRNAWPKRA